MPTGGRFWEKIPDFAPAEPQQRRSTIVEPKRKRTTIFGAVPDMTDEEHRRRGDAAGELRRKLVRLATSGEE